MKLRSSPKPAAGETGLEARWAVIQFALAGLAALLIVGVVAAIAFSRAGTDEAVDDARRLTRALATGVIEPNLRPGVLEGDPVQYRRFDRLVRRSIVGDAIVRAKLWSPQGRILYSDEPRLVGARYPLGEEETERLLAGVGVEAELAELSDLSGPENRFERQHGRLLEVYVPVTASDGQQALFELYMRYSSVTASGRKIWLTFAPALVIALVALWLVQIPLAGSLVRRLRSRERERERLLLAAMESSNAERRRIAGDLHDGVVQDMTGAALALSAAAARASTRPDDLRDALRDGAVRTRRSLRRLRSLLVDIYPPNLHSEGLEVALGDLLSSLPTDRIAAELDVDDAQPMPRHVEQIVFRTAQEALRNVAKHAHASRVSVRVETPDERAILTVEDDGRGFDPASADKRRSGHFGMSLIADRATDLGGSLSVESKPGEGTKLRLEVPSR